mmetsp:Transcript_51275/g.104275  ORF Transcript_51275/g.104275 Transcript_51275/m.104275 type:complete len:216 (-) Transcript_51275:3518-4165(-)
MLNIKDDLIWETIGGEKFCSFKFSTQKQFFCKNELNLTGFCSKQSCPLSNSRYATVVEKNGIIVLYQKDNKNLNFPDKSWKKIILSRNYLKAIQQLDSNLAFWPKFLVHRIKQKLTKLTQVLIRKRINGIKKKIIPDKNVPSILYKRNDEYKKLKKIKIQKIIEHELINRLNFGVYGNIYSPCPIQTWRKLRKSEPQTEEIGNFKKQIKGGIQII